MNVIICLDDNNGMLFNNRRQSRDKALLSDVFGNLQGERLYITSFSEKLMAEYSDRIIICESVSKLENGKWFFCENVDKNSIFGMQIEKDRKRMYKMIKKDIIDFFDEMGCSEGK